MRWTLCMRPAQLEAMYWEERALKNLAGMDALFSCTEQLLMLVFICMWAFKDTSSAIRQAYDKPVLILAITIFFSIYVAVLYYNMLHRQQYIQHRIPFVNAFNVVKVIFFAAAITMTTESSTKEYIGNPQSLMQAWSALAKLQLFVTGGAHHNLAAYGVRLPVRYAVIFSSSQCLISILHMGNIIISTIRSSTILQDAVHVQYTFLAALGMLTPLGTAQPEAFHSCNPFEVEQSVLAAFLLFYVVLPAYVMYVLERRSKQAFLKRFVSDFMPAMAASSAAAASGSTVQDVRAPRSEGGNAQGGQDAGGALAVDGHAAHAALRSVGRTCLHGLALLLIVRLCTFFAWLLAPYIHA
jgi:hypothetical protein